MKKLVVFFKLHFCCTLLVGVWLLFVQQSQAIEVADSRRLIEKLAEASGERFEYEKTEYSNFVFTREKTSLPAPVKNFAMQIIEELKAANDFDTYPNYYAWLSVTQYMIVYSGTVAGYVLDIREHYDYDECNSAGYYIYLHKNNNELEEVTRTHWQDF